MGIRTMSIQEGLNELKILDSRIKKAVREKNTYTTVVIGDRVVRGYESNEKFAEKAKSTFDSVVSLIDRRALIKSAIIKKNAEVIVEINGERMSLAEAINNKAFIEDKKVLLEQLTSQYNSAMFDLERAEQTYNDKLDNYLTGFVTKDTSKDSLKNNEAIMLNFNNANKPQFIDPVGIKEFIEKLSHEIESFEAKVDFVLTRANITNDIEFEDPTFEGPKPTKGEDLPQNYQ